MSKIVIVVSVDWEGRSLLQENLQAIATFRRAHPDVPLQHFLNAAYYSRCGINTARTTETIRQVLADEDEHGLHVHAWHSLLRAADVRGRNEPQFTGDIPAGVLAADDWGFYPAEAGYDVPLESFEADELDKIFRTSVAILISQGFRLPVCFRAGGWMAGERVMNALARNGFMLDCSAVNPRLALQRFGDIPLCRWLSELWPNIDETTQPYPLATSFGNLWQVPNNAGLVDYTSADELLAIFRRNVALWREAPERPCFISTGFHQETARKFINRLDEAITAIKRMADAEQLPVIFTAQPLRFLDMITL